MSLKDYLSPELRIPALPIEGDPAAGENATVLYGELEKIAHHTGAQPLLGQVVEVVGRMRLEQAILDPSGLGSRRRLMDTRLQLWLQRT